MKVGFIGTGAMGRPMARNLVAKGFTVVAYDVERAALAAARTLGARAAASAAAVAEESEVVVTMLPSSPHVEAAYLGAGGVLEGIAPGRLCVDMSTVDPGTSRRLASRLGERGVRFIDAPVSGGVSGAESGRWRGTCGGRAEEGGAVESARPGPAGVDGGAGL
jgi:2-hydroxy-3-oxopropionate reductase